MKSKIKQNKVPMRRCIACMKSKNKDELMRFVFRNDKPYFDVNKKMDGRGFYICKDQKCVDITKKRKFRQRFNMDALIPEMEEHLKNESKNL